MISIKDWAKREALRQAVGKPRGETVGNLGIGLPIVHGADWRCEWSEAERDNQVVHSRAREYGRPLRLSFPRYAVTNNSSQGPLALVLKNGKDACSAAGLLRLALTSTAAQVRPTYFLHLFRYLSGLFDLQFQIK